MMCANPLGALGRSSDVAALIDLTSDLRELVRRMFERLNAILNLLLSGEPRLKWTLSGLCE